MYLNENCCCIRHCLEYPTLQADWVLQYSCLAPGSKECLSLRKLGLHLAQAV